MDRLPKNIHRPLPPIRSLLGRAIDRPHRLMGWPWRWQSPWWWRSPHWRLRPCNEPVAQLEKHRRATRSLRHTSSALSLKRALQAYQLGSTSPELLAGSRVPSDRETLTKARDLAFRTANRLPMAAARSWVSTQNQRVLKLNSSISFNLYTRISIDSADMQMEIPTNRWRGDEIFIYIIRNIEVLIQSTIFEKNLHC